MGSYSHSKERCCFESSSSAHPERKTINHVQPGQARLRRKSRIDATRCRPRHIRTPKLHREAAAGQTKEQGAVWNFKRAKNARIRGPGHFGARSGILQSSESISSHFRRKNTLSKWTAASRPETSR